MPGNGAVLKVKRRGMAKKKKFNCAETQGKLNDQSLNPKDN